jgi:hypothetical protein
VDVSTLALALLLAQDPAPAGRIEDFESFPSAAVLPEGWRRLDGDGYPPYNRAEIRPDPAARSGAKVLRLATLGQAVAAEQAPDRSWPVEAGRPYRLSVWARLRGHRLNAASLGAVWRNARFEAITDAASAPLREGGAWRELAIELPPPPEGARWLSARLAFDGPDVRGECDFDRLELTPVVRLEIRPSGRRLALFEAGSPARLEIAAAGLPPGAHVVHIELIGGSGPADRQDLRLAPTASAAAPFELPALAPGAYRLSARLAAPDLRRDLAILVGPRRSAPADAPSPFGLAYAPVASRPGGAGELLGWVDARLARVVLWDVPPPGRGAPPTDEPLLDFLRELANGAPEDLEITGVLARPTRGIVPGRDADGSAEFPAPDPALSDSSLASRVRRLRELVPWWQAGEDAPAGSPDEFLQGGGDRRLKTIRAADTSGLLRRLIEHVALGGSPPAVVPAEAPLLDDEGAPGPGLLALRVANDLLAGARPRSPLLRLGAPVREFAFERGRRTVIALWCEYGEIEREIHMGEGAFLHSPLGPVHPLVPAERLRLGAMPVFVSGADAFLLESRSSLRLGSAGSPEVDDPTLPLHADPTIRRVRFRNLYPEGEILDLRIRLRSPPAAGWTLRPSLFRAERLGRGEEFSEELSISLPATEREREEELRFEIRFRKDGKEEVLHSTKVLRLVSPVGIDAVYSPESGRISFRVANGGARPLSLLLRLRLPGLPEQAEPIGPIPPGEAASTPGFPIGDVRMLPPEKRVAEVVGEERGGSRLQLRKSIPLP